LIAFFVLSIRDPDLDFGAALLGAIGVGIIFAGLTEIWVWAL
jgi:hypothetical protein